MRTNLQGPYFLTQAIARDQIERRRADPSFAAAIVFVTSVSAEMASVNRGDYCVGKAGLAMAAKLFAARLAADGIPVFEVRPGIIATDMTAAVRDVYDRRIADGLVPENRWGQPDDVGKAVAALRARRRAVRDRDDDHRRRRLVDPPPLKHGRCGSADGRTRSRQSAEYGLAQRGQRIARRHELVREIAGESGADDRAADGAPVHFLRVVELVASGHAAGVIVARCAP